MADSVPACRGWIAGCFAENGTRASLEAECGPVRFTVSRIDLHADFQGWLLTGDDRHNFVSRATCLTTFEDGSASNGLQFGKQGSKDARLHDTM